MYEFALKLTRPQHKVRKASKVLCAQIEELVTGVPCATHVMCEHITTSLLTHFISYTNTLVTGSGKRYNFSEILKFRSTSKTEFYVHQNIESLI